MPFPHKKDKILNDNKIINEGLFEIAQEEEDRAKEIENNLQLYDEIYGENWNDIPGYQILDSMPTSDIQK